MSKVIKPKRKKTRLSKKLLTSIIILTVIMCSASCAIGFIQYNHTIRKLYNENGYVVGRMILSEIDHNKIGEYSSTWKADSYYSEMKAYLEKVERASKAAYIYIIVPMENQKMRYIYDSSGCLIGDYDPVSSYYEDLIQIYRTGEEIKDEYFVRYSKKYGYLTSSILPVKDSGDKTVALLFVDVHMEVIVSTLVGYIFRVLVISAALLAVFGICYFIFMKRCIIEPIKVIKQNAYDFEESDGQLTDTLSLVRTGDEIQELAETISSMEHAIVRYIAHIERVTAEKERIGAELSVATQIQADMLPRIFPAFPGRKEFDIYASMTPAREVGGDFYDFFLVDENHLAMVMADVSGKGVPAALFMVIAKTLIKNSAQTGKTPAEILADVNDRLCEGNEAELFVTVWLAVLEISTGKGTAANAGHEHPILRRQGGKYELVKYRHSPAVATMEGLIFKEHEFELNPGDSFFVYTDGIPEANNKEHELFGTERMLDVLNRMPDAEPKKVLENVMEGINDFTAGAEQFDDITMMSFLYRS